MPADCFTFTVRVSCEIYFVCSFRFFFELLDERTLAADVYILCLEVVFNVDTERALEWMKKGAQPTDTVKTLLKRVGAL